MMKPGGEFLILLVEENIDRVYYELSKYPRWAAYKHEDYISSFFNQDGSVVMRMLLQETGFVNLNCFREYNVYRQKDKVTNDGTFSSLEIGSFRLRKTSASWLSKLEYRLGDVYNNKSNHL